jgi:hypothetical protein
LLFALRLDDAGWNPASEDKIDHGLSLFQRCHGLLQGLPYLAAVIPSCVDADGLAWLQSRPEGMRVAMHGLDHEPVEFRGLTMDECRERICQGRRALTEVPCGDLVLPNNQFEWGLGTACMHEGIRYLWGGGHHTRTDPSDWPTPPQPYPIENVIFVPSWKPTYAAVTGWMRDDIPPLREVLPDLLDWPGKAVLTVHITWEAGLHKDLEGIRWLADEIGSYIIPAAEYLNGNN